MSDSVRLLEARMALETATQAGVKVWRERGRIQVCAMVNVADEVLGRDPNRPIVKQLTKYRREIEDLLPNDGDAAASLPAPAVSGLILPKR